MKVMKQDLKGFSNSDVFNVDFTIGNLEDTYYYYDGVSPISENQKEKIILDVNGILIKEVLQLADVSFTKDVITKDGDVVFTFDLDKTHLKKFAMDENGEIKFFSQKKIQEIEYAEKIDTYILAPSKKFLRSIYDIWNHSNNMLSTRDEKRFAKEYIDNVMFFYKIKLY